ncbi:hypothetical protein BH11PSE11_BH11PSE11_36050 [soil metagenome]
MLQQAENCRDGGDLQAAETTYRRLLDAHAEHCEDHDLRTSALLIAGRFEEVDAAIRHAAPLMRILADTCNQFGIMLATARRNEEAEALYRQALAADSGFVDARCNLARLLCKEKRFGEAAKHFCAALNLQSDNFNAMIGLAQALSAAGQSAAAEAALKKARDIWPEFAHALQTCPPAQAEDRCNSAAN